jgi:hypothetical protein
MACLRDHFDLDGFSVLKLYSARCQWVMALKKQNAVAETGQLASQVNALVLELCSVFPDGDEAINYLLDHLNLLLPNFYILP